MPEITVDYSYAQARKRRSEAAQDQTANEVARLRIARGRAEMARPILVRTIWGPMRPLVKITSDIRSKP